MLTVKLKIARPLVDIGVPAAAQTIRYAHETMIVEAKCVRVNHHRPGEFASIDIDADGSGIWRHFWNISKDGEKVSGIDPDYPFAHEAYIENSAGKTTESIKFA